jgi:ribonuclease Y
MYIVIGILVGIGGGYFIATTMLRKGIEKKSEQLIKDAEAEAEVIKKDKMLQAKEKFLQLKSDHEKSISKRNNEVGQAENRIKQKEGTLSQRLEESKRKEGQINKQRELLEKQSDTYKIKQPRQKQNRCQNQPV